MEVRLGEEGERRHAAQCICQEICSPGVDSGAMVVELGHMNELLRAKLTLQLFSSVPHGLHSPEYMVAAEQLNRLMRRITGIYYCFLTCSVSQSVSPLASQPANQPASQSVSHRLTHSLTHLLAHSLTD